MQVMRQSPPAIRRAYAIQRVKARLARESFPRLQMGLIVALTGGFGLLSSFALLQSGVGSMALRYPIALSLAYAFFSSHLAVASNECPRLHRRARSLWCVANRSGWRRCHAPLKAAEMAILEAEAHRGAFDGPGDAVGEAVSSPMKTVSDSVASVAEADELAIPLVAIALALGIALASFYVVYIAPVLFAEVLVDGALSYALFRRLNREDARHWLSSTFATRCFRFWSPPRFCQVWARRWRFMHPGLNRLGRFLITRANIAVQTDRLTHEAHHYAG